MLELCGRYLGAQLDNPVGATAEDLLTPNSPSRTLLPALPKPSGTLH